jgi:uncharacterized membrane protein
VRLKLLRNKPYLAGVLAALPVLKALSPIVPALCNNFAFLVLKPRIPEDLFPWLTAANGKLALNKGWLTARYHRSERKTGVESP